MKLFDDFVRFDSSHKKKNEALFDFYNRSSRRPFVIYRRMLHRWLSEIDEPERGEIISRFRTRDDYVYESTFAELLSFRLFRKLKYTVEIHPILSSGKRVDFLVSPESPSDAFFTEVTVRGKTPHKVGRDKNEHELYEAIDGLRIAPNQRFAWKLLKSGKTTPNLKKFKTEIRAWAKLHVNSNLTGRIDRKDFEISEWKVRLDLFGGHKSRRDARSIGYAMGRVRQLGGVPNFTKVLEKKATKYGKNFDKPLVLVVADSTDDFGKFGDGADSTLRDAVLGDLVHEDTLHVNGKVSHRTVRTNGLWNDDGRVRNKHISAVIYLPDTTAWKLRDPDCQPLIAHNPWATHSLSETTIPLPRLVPRGDRYVKKRGRSLANIIGLSSPWPPDEYND